MPGQQYERGVFTVLISCRRVVRHRSIEGVGEHRAAVERLRRLAADRRPDDRLLSDFLGAYYDELPEFDSDDRRDHDLYAVALAHLNLGRTLQPGETIARVIAPDRDRDGWHSDRSVALIVTRDAPFLVDTVRLVLERHGVTTHLLVHPMLAVRRDEQHQIVDVADDLAVIGEGFALEAWTQVEIDRLAPEPAAAVEAELVAAVSAVHRVVADFTEMRDRMLALAPLDPLLDWLAHDQFVFLGAATYDLTSDGPAMQPDSALGQLAADSPIDPPIEPGAPRVSVIARPPDLDHPPAGTAHGGHGARRVARRRTDRPPLRRPARLDRLSPERAVDPQRR